MTHVVSSLLQLDAGWTLAPVYDVTKKLHPMLKNFRLLPDKVSVIPSNYPTLWQGDT